MKVGVNSFVWMDESLYAPFDCIRLYNDMDFTQNERGLYTYAPTKKNTDFNYDTVLKNLTTQGKSALITTHKKAQWLGVGKFESKPLEVGANPEDPLSYTIFSQHLYQQQARWGATIQPLENIKTFTGIFYGVYKNQPLTGLGYNIKQMPLNETNADWWTIAEYWTPKQLAAVWSAAFDGHGGAIPLGGIKTADPQAFIVFPSLAYGTRKGLTIRQYMDAFLSEFQLLRPDLLGNGFPFDAIGINFYCRSGNKGADPFDTVLYDEFVWWKQQFQLPIYLTEFGYDEIKPSKQCPDNYPNMDIFKTKNRMIDRGILLADAAGVDEFYYYQIRDEHPSDAGLYRTCGLITSNQAGYQKKSSYMYLENYLPAYKANNSKVIKTGARTLSIDGTNFSFNPDGTTTEVTNTPPMAYHTLSVINKQLQWEDGTWCNLIHADSPEPRLHPNYKAAFSAECKALPTKGINCITVTMRGDDVTAINPWLNNNPSQGVDIAKLQTWHSQLKEFLDECEKNGLRGVVIAYLGERTNFKSITDQQYEAWFIEMGKIFADISGQIIFGWEEIWDGSDLNTMLFADRVGSLLKSYLPKSLLMVHNNPSQKPFNAASSFVKLICIQETSIAAMKATAQAALAKGYAVHFHELYGQVKLSNSQDANKAIMKSLCEAAMSIGVKNVGCFANDYDLSSPDASKLGYLYEYQSQLLSGTTPNPSPMRKVFITRGTAATYTDDGAATITIEQGEIVPVGTYAMYVDGDGPVDLEVLRNGVSFIAKRTESGKPLAFGGDDGGKLRLKAFKEGSYVAKVSGQADLIFTVGTGTPTPTKEPVTETYYEGGKVYFKTANRTVSISAT